MAGALGAEVRGIKLASADEGDRAEIKRLLVKHMVLFFPEQYMTQDEHVAFGKPFGPQDAAVALVAGGLTALVATPCEIEGCA